MIMLFSNPIPNMQFPSSHNTLFVLPFLREYLLPHLHPLLLLQCKCLARCLKRLIHNLTKLCSQSLDHEHSLPIWYCKTSTISIEDKNARVHLGKRLVWSLRVEWGDNHIAADISTQESNCKFFYSGSLVRIVESVDISTGLNRTYSSMTYCLACMIW